MSSKPIKIQGEIMWAFLDTPNKMSGKYQVDICNLSKAAVEALKGIGLEARKKEDKGYYITPKSMNFAIKVTDSEGAPITAKVGNGSKGIALVYAYESKSKPGLICAGISSLQVTDLIVYEGTNNFETADDVL
jgi:hypothetical protein